jgi:hypothetical protein
MLRTLKSRNPDYGTHDSLLNRKKEDSAMKKCILLLLIASLLGAGQALAYAKPTAVLGPGLNSGRTAYHQAWNRTLSADTVYTLTGLYYVDSLRTITIPAGTVIMGDTAATLIVKRGAKIYATGSAHAPIVFTSLKAPGQRNPGDWGGVILLGRAPCNKVEPLIEGGIIGGSYGGSVANDTTGVFKYVRIEWAGYRFQLNNEVNGLTMGGVGSGTEMHHVQVSYAFDDSFEWFGGTVNAKYLVTFGGTDDEFDTDFGYQGKVQFCFGLRDPYWWDPTGESNGFESDNDGSSTSTATPYTHPIFSNVTLIGPQLSSTIGPPVGHRFQYGAVLRRSTRTSIYNSIIGGYPWGLSLRDTYTKQAAHDDVLQWRSLSMTAHLLPTGSTHIHDETRWPTADAITPGVRAWFDLAGYNNKLSTARYLTAVGINMTDINNPNPVPAVGSEPDGSADFSSPNLADFAAVPYRGAFKPGDSFATQWTAEWTNFNPQDTDYNPVQTGTDAPIAKAFLQNFPNPFNPSTRIVYTVPSKGHVVLKVYDVAGKAVATLVDKDMAAGNYEINFNAEKLASGVYFYSLSGVGFSETRKMVLLR